MTEVEQKIEQINNFLSSICLYNFHTCIVGYDENNFPIYDCYDMDGCLDNHIMQLKTIKVLNTPEEALYDLYKSVLWADPSDIIINETSLNKLKVEPKSLKSNEILFSYNEHEQNANFNMWFKLSRYGFLKNVKLALLNLLEEFFILIGENPKLLEISNDFYSYTLGIIFSNSMYVLHFKLLG